jgi:hypothetical protein
MGYSTWTAFRQRVEDSAVVEPFDLIVDGAILGERRLLECREVEHIRLPVDRAALVHPAFEGDTRLIRGEGGAFDALVNHPNRAASDTSLDEIRSSARC